MHDIYLCIILIVYDYVIVSKLAKNWYLREVIQSNFIMIPTDFIMNKLYYIPELNAPKRFCMDCASSPMKNRLRWLTT